MLLKLSEGCTKILLSHNKIGEYQQDIYNYGFKLLFSTVSCIGCVLFLGLVFNHFEQTLVFILYFIPVRIAGGGYHAKTYHRCFLYTNAVALGSTFLAKIVWASRSLPLELPLLLLFVCTMWYIWNNVPIIPVKYQNKTKREIVNRKYAHVILTMEIVIIVLLKYYNCNLAVYTAIVTSYFVAFMMKLAKKGGQ